MIKSELYSTVWFTSPRLQWTYSAVGSQGNIFLRIYEKSFIDQACLDKMVRYWQKTTTTIIFGHLDLTLGQKCNNEFLSHTITNQRKTKQRRTKFEPTKNWTTTHLHVCEDKTCLISGTVFYSNKHHPQLSAALE